MRREADGISVTVAATHLAGQSALHVAAQLRAYRGGARRNEVMNVLAKPLSNEDIASLAAWLSASGPRSRDERRLQRGGSSGGRRL
jgi:cytochrome c553